MRSEPRGTKGMKLACKAVLKGLTDRWEESLSLPDLLRKEAYYFWQEVGGILGSCRVWRRPPLLQSPAPEVGLGGESIPLAAHLKPFQKTLGSSVSDQFVNKFRSNKAWQDGTGQGIWTSGFQLGSQARHWLAMWPLVSRFTSFCAASPFPVTLSCVDCELLDRRYLSQTLSNILGSLISFWTSTLYHALLLKRIKTNLKIIIKKFHWMKSSERAELFQYWKY